MPFSEITNRQSEYSDFRVSFIGFEPDGARISVGVKQPQEYVQNILNIVSSENSTWNSFYSNLSTNSNVALLGQEGLGESISEYLPIHSYDPNYNFFTDPILKGGEFVIQINQDIYFWIQVPVIIFGTSVLIGFTNDSILEGTSLKIGFGEEVPDNTDIENNQYLFYIPIFKINVSNNGINILNYDLGECVFLSPEFDVTDGTVFQFSETSSYFD